VGGQFSFAQYGGTRIILTGLAAIASLVAAALYVDRVSTLLIIAMVVGAKAFESVSNLAYGAFQQSGRMDLVAKSFALRGSITLLAFVGFLLLGASTAVALFAQLVVWGLVGLLFDYPRASRLVAGRVVMPRATLRESWTLLRHSAPLGGGLLANSLQMTVTRIMVERFLGLEALGLFTAIGYFQQAGVTASNSVSNAIVNRLARLSRNGERAKLRSIMLKLFAAFAAVAALGIGAAYFYGDVILAVLFGHAYRQAAPLLFIIAIVVSLRMFSTLPQSLLFAEQRFKEFMSFQLVLLALTLGLGLYAIPRYGIIGAGFVLLFVAVVRFAILELILMLRRTKAAPKGDAK
jgi:O-antigen/teichoic acid export membrane protein